MLPARSQMTAGDQGSLASPPDLSPAEVESLVSRHYGLDGHAEALTGERDANFRVQTEAGRQFVFRATRAWPQETDLDLPDRLLLHLENTGPDLPVPRVERTITGRTRISLLDARGRHAEAMLCTYIPGELLMSVRRCRQQRWQCGQWLAQLARALRDFDQPSCHRHLIWDLRRFADVARLLVQLPGALQRPALENFSAAFCSRVAPALERLRRQVVHNDLNARNVIVDSEDTTQVVGIIDFSDAVHTALAADLAVGAVGQLASPDAACESIGEFVAAYQAVEPLCADELAILNWMVAARLVTNYVVVSWNRARQPDDAHFAAFGPEYFGWRLELALSLAADPRSVTRWL